MPETVRVYHRLCRTGCSRVSAKGAKLDNDAALQIVNMYINTRGVGLAEAFEHKCRNQYGLPADRRYARGLADFITGDDATVT